MRGEHVDFRLPLSEMEQLCGPITRDQAEQLGRYGTAVLAASSRLNVVSRQSLGRVGEHFVDSAALLAFTEIDGQRVVDLGSGGGFPGVVLAVLRSDARVALVESRRGKVVFLKKVVRELDLANVEVIHERIEKLGGGGRFDLGVARALGEVTRVLPGCIRAVSPKGRLVLFKGPAWDAEKKEAEQVAEELGYGIASTETVDLPGLGRATTFVEFHVKHTDGAP